MNGLTKLVRLAAAIVISAALGACGGSSTSPAAPSKPAPVPASTPAAAAQAPASGGATIDGTIVGMSGAQRFAIRPQAAGPTVGVAGTPVTSPIDGAGHFSLQGVPPGDVVLQITASGVNASLPVGAVAEHEQVHLTIDVSGSTATEDEGDRETADNQAEVEGKITAIGGDTVTVAGKVVTVPAGTPIHHGATAVAFADLHVGDRVHVHGTRSGAGVAATDVELQTANPGNPGPPTAPPSATPDPGDGGDHGSEAEVSGPLSGLAGACPALAFTVSSTQVTTDGSTRFEGVKCSALANGSRVEVQGTKQANGSVVAARVTSGR